MNAPPPPTWMAAARLLAWLGPWGGERVPRSVARTEIEITRGASATRLIS